MGITIFFLGSLAKNVGAMIAALLNISSTIKKEIPLNIQDGIFFATHVRIQIFESNNGLIRNGGDQGGMEAS